MAIISDVSYVISEEQDGFVAVDFDFINGLDDEIRDWEIVDDCSSIGEKTDDDVDFTPPVQSYVASECLSDNISVDDCDDDITGSVQSDVPSECLTGEISVEDLKSLPEYSPEMFLSYRRSAAADGDVIKYVPGGEVEDDDDNLCENGEDLHELFGSEEMESVPDYLPEMNVRDRQFNTDDSMEEMLARQIDLELLSNRSFCDYEYDYNFDLSGGYEEDDLDDELVPYSAKVKLWRERMRKLGKRSCSKLVKSKRLTYNYNKAGCFRGKHGLGLKHSLI